MMHRPRPLQVERLEDRAVPAVFGIPWADPSRITLSFVPDGTPMPGGGQSSLFKQMNAVVPTATWEGEILRAFQTWASNANLNVALVPDSGLPLDTPGAVQGDTRFGDIRISARALGDKLVSDATPFSWTGATRSGDVSFNTRYKFSIGNVWGKYDLYTVALHEAGHVFGIDGNTLDTTSALYETYVYHTGLSASDIQAIRNLYTARPADAFDAGTGNNTFATASVLANVGTRATTSADITTITDLDYYQITAPIAPGLTSISFRVKASQISLLTPSLTVYSSAQKQLKTAATTDPLNDDVTITLTGVTSGATYYVRVGSTRTDAFGVGAYRLTIDYLYKNAAPPTDAQPAYTPVADNSTNDTLATATDTAVRTAAKADARFDVALQAQISSSTDLDYYKIHAPNFGDLSPVNMLAMGWALNANGLNPRLHIFDAAGNPVAFQVFANSAGDMSVYVPNLVQGGTYYVEVSASDLAHNVGNYFLGVNFEKTSNSAFDQLAGTTLTSLAPIDAGTLTVTAGSLFQFALSATTADPAATATVTMTIANSHGTSVAVLTANANQPTSTLVVYLSAGTYTVSYSAAPTGLLPDVTYSMFATVIQADSLGPVVTVTAKGGGGPPAPDYTYVGTSVTVATGNQFWF
ncbi:MAG: matrixin family metalloprotease [Gemmataceae bacterium]